MGGIIAREKTGVPILSDRSPSDRVKLGKRQKPNTTSLIYIFRKKEKSSPNNLGEDFGKDIRPRRESNPDLTVLETANRPSVSRANSIN